MAPLARSEVNDVSRGSCSNGIVSKDGLKLSFYVFIPAHEACLSYCVIIYYYFKKAV